MAKRESSDACVDQLEQRYQMAMQGVQVKPKELDSTIKQICLMADLHAAQAEAKHDKGAGITANALRQLAVRLSPGVCEDDSEKTEAANGSGSTVVAGEPADRPPDTPTDATATTRPIGELRKTRSRKRSRT
ncbi:MAG: hypothetical protein MZV70_53215 [Desulfobacterales bacterium]|nr:hypothetical protein [Desulfobacterales bacterium]